MEELSKNLRLLLNHKGRAPIRPDFPNSTALPDPYARRYPGNIIQALKTQVSLRQEEWKDVKRISIAYPHKHPGLFKNHRNAAARVADKLQQELTAYAPYINWIKADGICETIHFGRSENQSSIHAITGKQKYEFLPSMQTADLPFIRHDNPDKEKFILVDSQMWQGTTLANLMDCINYNNGDVLAIVTNNEVRIAQETGSAAEYDFYLKSEFTDAAMNTGRLKEMAYSFQKSAGNDGKTWSPNDCMTIFNQCLNAHGMSVYALTEGECLRLIDTTSSTDVIHETWQSQSFASLISDLEKSALKL